MPEFLKLLPPLEALKIFLEAQDLQPVMEHVKTIDAIGRVTVDPVIAPYPLPSFPRSTVDGFAVRAADTYGASDSLPAYLEIVGEVPMGSVPEMSLHPAQCALIHTGGMLPKGADAVVMVEFTQSARSNEVEIFRAVAVGENVLKVGEDVAAGQEVIAAGTRLRPAEIGGAMALGITQLSLAKKPRVAIISSGDEVIPPDEELAPGQVRDVNSYSLGALVEDAGGIPVRYGILPDRLEIMQGMAEQALEENNLVVITAGSSASARDLTSQVIGELGEPGVLVHGVNLRPGKPTILAVCDGKPVIGLPGNPVSALVIASLFMVPVIERLSGLRTEPLKPHFRASLSLNVASQAGREDWIPVRILAGQDGYIAEPIFGKSNLIFILVRADGLVRIPPAANGLTAGTIVEVRLF